MQTACSWKTKNGFLFYQNINNFYQINILSTVLYFFIRENNILNIFQIVFIDLMKTVLVRVLLFIIQYVLQSGSSAIIVYMYCIIYNMCV